MSLQSPSLSNQRLWQVASGFEGPIHEQAPSFSRLYKVRVTFYAKILSNRQCKFTRGRGPFRRGRQRGKITAWSRNNCINSDRWPSLMQRSKLFPLTWTQMLTKKRRIKAMNRDHSNESKSIICNSIYYSRYWLCLANIYLSRSI